MPRTKAERKQEFVELYDRGALDMNEPKVKEKVFELFGDTGAMSTFNDDARRARRNMRSMKDGLEVPFRIGIDSPDIHLGIALETAKALDFDKWDDGAKVLLYTYIEKINQAIAAMMPPVMPGPNPDEETPGAASPAPSPGR
jgi:hypothetical protein